MLIEERKSKRESDILSDDDCRVLAVLFEGDEAEAQWSLPELVEALGDLAEADLLEIMQWLEWRMFVVRFEIALIRGGPAEAVWMHARHRLEERGLGYKVAEFEQAVERAKDQAADYAEGKVASQ